MEIPPIMNGPTDPHGYGQEVPPYTVLPGGSTNGLAEILYGEAGRPVPEYIPTRNELLVLVHHYVDEEVHCQAFWDTFTCVGSYELRLVRHARERISRIAELLGEAAEEKIQEFYEGCDLKWRWHLLEEDPTILEDWLPTWKTEWIKKFLTEEPWRSRWKQNETLHKMALDELSKRGVPVDPQRGDDSDGNDIPF
jgi:hypothetical protein